jgi:hypothetical protein
MVVDAGGGGDASVARALQATKLTVTSGNFPGQPVLGLRF